MGGFNGESSRLFVQNYLMLSVVYRNDVEGLSAAHLTGFFVGWPKPPSSEELLKLLQGSHYRWIAEDIENGQVIGYVTALSDGVLFSYVSSLEVLPEYQGQGIGQELMRLILSDLGEVYATDLVCDANVQPFYEKCGMLRCAAMVVRRPHKIGQRAENS